MDHISLWIDRCPACGRDLDGIPNIFRGTQQQQIFEYIKRYPGRSMKQIVDYIYGNDPNGGPTSNSVSVQINQMNKILASRGLRITGRSKKQSGYCIEEIECPPPSRA